MGKIAVILSGCGHLDGAEIHESVLCLYHLARHGHQFECFAPDVSSKYIVNHLTKEIERDIERNVLVESARIARGKIKDLNELNPHQFQAIVLPGGFGVALNLSDFAEKGERCKVNETLKKILLEFYKQKKPIGATCITPAIVAKVFENVASLKLTLGSNPENKEMLDHLGMKGCLAKIDQNVADEEHLVFTTPCYMEPENLMGVFKGIEQMIDKLTQAIVNE